MTDSSSISLPTNSVAGSLPVQATGTNTAARHAHHSSSPNSPLEYIPPSPPSPVTLSTHHPLPPLPTSGSCRPVTSRTAVFHPSTLSSPSSRGSRAASPLSTPTPPPPPPRYDTTWRQPHGRRAAAGSSSSDGCSRRSHIHHSNPHLDLICATTSSAAPHAHSNDLPASPPCTQNHGSTTAPAACGTAIRAWADRSPPGHPESPRPPPMRPHRHAPITSAPTSGPKRP